MVCEHLHALETALLERNIPVTFRGQAWSENCREWVYFGCFIDPEATREKFSLPDFVKAHSHRGTHDGQESGFVCLRCHDAIIGFLDPVPGKPDFP
jgi:hypothetical protein